MTSNTSSPPPSTGQRPSGATISSPTQASSPRPAAPSSTRLSADEFKAAIAGAKRKKALAAMVAGRKGKGAK